MFFEVTDMQAGKGNGYQPMSLLKNDSTDINWEKGSLKWCSHYSKALSQMMTK